LINSSQAEALGRLSSCNDALRTRILLVGHDGDAHLGVLLCSLLQSPHMSAVLGGLQAVVSLCEADLRGADVLMLTPSKSGTKEPKLLERLEYFMGSTQPAIRMLSAWAYAMLLL
jgi:hypothetical protein